MNKNEKPSPLQTYAAIISGRGEPNAFGFKTEEQADAFARALNGRTTLIHAIGRSSLRMDAPDGYVLCGRSRTNDGPQAHLDYPFAVDVTCEPIGRLS